MSIYEDHIQPLERERDALRAECQKRGEEAAKVRKEKEEMFRQSILTIKSWKDLAVAAEAEVERLKGILLDVQKYLNGFGGGHADMDGCGNDCIGLPRCLGCRVNQACGNGYVKNHQ